ncbi:helix-turn-helix domain-containing protein [Streptomyces sp. NPDC000618]|uniref:nSTAND1 domain-containing NTPase n=1 Tax=Streptomyces sp. NPDC000618 TaxID=3154265 RepID=UPI0033229E8F
MGQSEGEDGGITFGSELRRRRTAEGLSLGALAERLRTSKGYLSRLENDLQRPSEPFARAVDEALKAGGALLARVAGPGTGVCPYPGLTSFKERDAEWYFGRERAIADLVGLLADPNAAGHLAVLVGPSGIGKSSLLRAGLAAAVARGALPTRQPGTPETLYLTPTAHPMDELRGHSSRQSLESRALVIVDQFEELFTLCADETERAAYIRELCAYAADGLPVAIGLRADFYGHCLAHPPLVVALRRRSLPLGPMTTSELRQAITEPATAVGLSLEPGLVEVLLRDLAVTDESGPGHAGTLPLLSHTLRATWQHRTGDKLTVAGYKLTGGVQRAVAATAERVYEALDPQRRSAARAVLLSLVRVGEGEDDTRKRVKREELDELGESVGAVKREGCAGSDPSEALESTTHRARQEIATVVEEFTQARLLTADADHVEISHEALLRAWPRLRQWVDDDRDELRVMQQLADTARAWEQAGRDPHLLYQGVRLAAAQELATRRALGSREGGFLRSSEERQDAQARAERVTIRRLRALTGALTVLALLVAGLAGFALEQKGEAMHNATQARRQAAEVGSTQLALAAAEARAQGRPETADLLAAEAYRLGHGVRARSALLSTQAEFLAHRRTPPRGSAPRRGQAVSADGRTLATYDTAGRVELWRLPGWQPIRTLDTGLDTIDRLAIAADGRAVAAASEGESHIWLWEQDGAGDSGTGRGIERRLPTPSPYPVASLAFRPHGRTLAVADGGAEVFLIELDHPDNITLRASDGPGTRVWAVAYSPDGALFATAGLGHAPHDREVRLWDTDSYKQLGACRIQDWELDFVNVLALAFAPDGRSLGAVGDDQLAAVWNDLRTSPKGTSCQPARPLATPVVGSAMSSVAFSGDGTLLATAGEDLHVRLWSVRHAKSLISLAGHRDLVRGIAFTDHDRTLLSTSADGTTAVWDLTRGFLPGADGSPQHSVSWLPDGRTLVASADETPRMFDTERRIRTGVFKGHRLGVFRTAVSGDGRTLATSGNDSTVRLWNTATDKESKRFTTVRDVCGLALSRSGRVLAAGIGLGHLSLWIRGPERGSAWRTVLKDFPIGTRNPCALAISPDERVLALGADDGTVRLLDLTHPAPGAHQFTDLGTHGDSVRGIAFHPDGHTVATAGADKQVKLWDVARRKPARAPLVDFPEQVSGVAFNRQGTLLATIGLDGVIRLWSTRTWRLHAALTGHQQNGDTVAFHPRDNILASVSNDGTIRLWDLNEQRVRRTVCARDLKSGHTDWKRYAPHIQPPTDCG